MGQSAAESFWIEHLLRRAGFGFSPTELAYYKSLGYEGAVKELLNPEQVSNSQLDDAIARQRFDFTNLDDLKRWWIYRMAFTRKPLEEKMTLFWHGHFATSNRKVGNAYTMYQQNALMRKYALKNFGDLLLAMSEDPAMIIWLDNQQNHKGKPNENYAREVMELFSVGIGHYTEPDIKEAARAFTGWETKANAFFFNASQHDSGDKIFLGERGNFNGNDIVDILAHKPATANFLARKLCKFFVSDNPSEEMIKKIAHTYKPNDTNVKKMLAAIFTHPDFFTAKAYHAKIKSPAELVIGTIKSLQVQKLDATLPSQMSRMGQNLFEPPSVKGWDGGTSWISTNTVMERFNFAARITQEKFDAIEAYITPAALVKQQGLTNPDDTINYFLSLLVDGDVPASTRAELKKYVTTDYSGKVFNGKPDDQIMDAKLRGLVHLIMTLPTYQLA